MNRMNKYIFNCQPIIKKKKLAIVDSDEENDENSKSLAKESSNIGSRKNSN